MTTGRLRALLLILLLMLQMPAQVLGQDPIAKEALDEWFYSRILLGLVFGVVAGVVIGLVHLCRLHFTYQGALNVNSPARLRMLIWLAVIFIAGAILLFLDAWFVYPFGATLGFWDVLTQVWTNYRMLLVLLSTTLVAGLVAAVATRLKSDCRCRYAFIPGPEGK